MLSILRKKSKYYKLGFWSIQGS